MSKRGWIDTILDTMRLNDEDDEDDVLDDDLYRMERENRKKERQRKKEEKRNERMNAAAQRYSDDSDDTEEEEEAEADSFFQERDNKVVSFKQAGKQKKLLLYYIEPDSFEMAQRICDRLLENMVIIINFERLAYTSKETWQRIVDFIYGASYVLDTEIRVFSNYEYVMIPDGVTLTESELRSICSRK